MHHQISTRSSLLLSAAVLAGIGATPHAAIAQEAAAPVDEIVVTAQRRDQNLQDVPVAITAVTPARLEQLSIRKLDQLEEIGRAHV